MLSTRPPRSDSTDTHRQAGTATVELRTSTFHAPVGSTRAVPIWFADVPIVAPAYTRTLFDTRTLDVPSTTQRPLPSFLARMLARLSSSGVSVMIAVSHVGAEQPTPLSAALRTRTCIRIGVVVFGNRNVSFELVLSPLRATGVPSTCDHSSFDALIEDEASRVSGRFCSTVAPTGAISARAGATSLTLMTTSSVFVVVPLLTVSVNVSEAASFGAVNVAFDWSAPVSVMPAGPLQLTESMSPAEPPPSRVTLVPCSTVTVSGGAGVWMSVWPVASSALSPKPGSVSDEPESVLSLEEAVMCSLSPPPLLAWYTA